MQDISYGGSSLPLNQYWNQHHNDVDAENDEKICSFNEWLSNLPYTVDYHPVDLVKKQSSQRIQNINSDASATSYDYKCILCRCETNCDSFVFLRDRKIYQNDNSSLKNGVNGNNGTKGSMGIGMEDHRNNYSIIEKIWEGIMEERQSAYKFLGRYVYYCGCNYHFPSYSFYNKYDNSTYQGYYDQNQQLSYYNNSECGYWPTPTNSMQPILSNCRYPMWHFPRKPYQLPKHHPYHDMLFIFPKLAYHKHYEMMLGLINQSSGNDEVHTVEIQFKGTRRATRDQGSRCSKKDEVMEMYCTAGNQVYVIPVKQPNFTEDNYQRDLYSSGIMGQNGQSSKSSYLPTMDIWNFIKWEANKDLQHGLSFPGILMDSEFINNSTIENDTTCDWAVSICESCKDFISQVTDPKLLPTVILSHMQERFDAVMAENYISLCVYI
ncbi:hypothetical protein BdWA1_001195 [Babesia duncani]|uniref:Uncharacterized protein n=1 Tax=Babesia duncani TaxID=323732 RepID=A0AAD9PP71_9APIC|nr:hypothetical protein BdWA1_001195 [Babesia duncani]